MVHSYRFNLIHKRNENLSYTEIPFPTYQMRKKKNNPTVWQQTPLAAIGNSVGKQAHSYIAVGPQNPLWKHLAIPSNIT